MPKRGMVQKSGRAGGTARKWGVCVRNAIYFVIEVSRLVGTGTTRLTLAIRL